ncbi:hypothetical protein, partial [Nocardia gipuzkoensis]|uniref:hypothetical protein n=1 Tax=Nocardia gipuzkoensis TaxID=2749991 RepID=UPI002455D6C8
AARQHRQPGVDVAQNYEGIHDRVPLSVFRILGGIGVDLALPTKRPELLEIQVFQVCSLRYRNLHTFAIPCLISGFAGKEPQVAIPNFSAEVGPAQRYPARRANSPVAYSELPIRMT